MEPLPLEIGRYQIRERLGQGGMGVLYLALDPVMDRLVALKVLRVNDPSLHERFLREARLVARLQHPHIITIYDVGEYDGQPFIAMEYVAGDTIDTLIRRRSHIPLARKLEWAMELCEALASAHRAGIVHRDVKPSNLIVHRESGRLKVLDFGIARTIESGVTQGGLLMGTPNYMAPEQVEGRTVDHRSDVFAVGAVLYELLVYRPAFTGDTPFAILHQIVHGRPEPLTDVDPSLDSALARIVEQALAKDPNARYADLDVIRRDLADVRQRCETDPSNDTIIVARATAARAARGIDLTRLVEQRAAQVGECLRTVDAALDANEPDRAMAAAEQAALIDPTDPRVAVAVARARSACDARDVHQWLTDAKSHLARGAITEAVRLAAFARQLDPGSAAVQLFQREVDRAASEQERQRDRARLVQRSLAHAQRSLATGQLNAALRAVAEAQGYDPASSEALALRRRIEVEIAQQEAAERLFALADAPPPAKPDNVDAVDIAAVDAPSDTLAATPDDPAAIRTVELEAVAAGLRGPGSDTQAPVYVGGTPLRDTFGSLPAPTPASAAATRSWSSSSGSPFALRSRSGVAIAATAAVLLLAVIAGLWWTLARSRGTRIVPSPTPTAAQRPPASADTTAPTSAGAPASASSTPASASSATPPTTTSAATSTNPAIDSALATIQQLVPTRDRQRALDLAAQTSAAHPNDPRVQDALSGLVRGAEASARRARASAIGAQADIVAVQEFDRADQEWRRAAGLQHANRPIDGTRSYWRAERLFGEAARVARDSRTTTASNGSTNGADAASTRWTRTDNFAVRQTLNRWASAYSTLDVLQIVDVYPTMSADQGRRLMQTFKNVTRYAVAFERCAIDGTGPRASADCTVQRTMAFKNGETRTLPARLRFSLERRDASWIIINIRGV